MTEKQPGQKKRIAVRFRTQCFFELRQFALNLQEKIIRNQSLMFPVENTAGIINFSYVGRIAEK
ncbi:MAG TPA: hypothetical protein DDZ11_11015 [Lentisphaeria bacterium]|nr:hypothetical protein [Lentisphaeria bacterium]